MRARGLLLGFSGVLAALNVALVVKAYPDSSWDARIYCAARDSVRDGLDPYRIENLQRYFRTPFSFAYPPTALPLLGHLCGGNVPLRSYASVTLLLLGTGLVLGRPPGPRRRERLLLATLLASGFTASYWTYLSGNAAGIELLLFAVAFRLVAGGRLPAAGGFVGASALLKLQPLFFALLFLLAPAGIPGRVVSVGMAVAVVGLALGASAWLYPELIGSYLDAITGHIPGQHTPLLETGGTTNPTLHSFFARALGAGAVADAVTVLCSLAVVAFFLRRVLRDRFPFADIFALGVLALLVISPRIKPYSFLFALPAIHHLLRGRSAGFQLGVLGIVGGLPAAALLIRLAPGRPPFQDVNLVLDHAQLLCLVGAFALLALDAPPVDASPPSRADPRARQGGRLEESADAQRGGAERSSELELASAAPCTWRADAGSTASG